MSFRPQIILALALFVPFACSPPPGGDDAGSSPDAGEVVHDDAGAPDAGGGTGDAGEDVDAGGTDAGGTDAGGVDAGPTCPTGTAECDDDPGTECETDITTALNCRACGVQCVPTSNTVARCGETGCELRCLSGHNDCDDDLTNGCESDPDTDPLNCGGCEAPCPVPAHSVASCASATCAFTCLDGFGDCDGDPANGCEQPLDDDAHCGSCEFACSGGTHATGACGTDSTCSVTCDDGFGDCNGSATDGCESTFATDVNHCGSCSNACPARTSAEARCVTDQSGSACDYSCLTGHDDCDNDPANGCEADLSAPATCGSCGHSCGAGEACVDGQCSACGLPTQPLTLVPGTVATWSGAVSGASAIDSASCQSTTKGPEVVFSFSTAAPKGFILTSTGYDSVASIRTGCADAATELACADDPNGAASPATVRADLAAGGYYAVVDKYASSPSTTGGTLGVSALLFDPVQNARCNTPKTLTNAGLQNESFEFALTRPGTAACATTNSPKGPSLWYAYALPAYTSVVLTATPSSSLAVTMRVLDSCAATTCVGSSTSASTGSARTFTLENRTANPRPLILEIQAQVDKLQPRHRLAHRRRDRAPAARRERRLRDAHRPHARRHGHRPGHLERRQLHPRLRLLRRPQPLVLARARGRP